MVSKSSQKYETDLQKKNGGSLIIKAPHLVNELPIIVTEVTDSNQLHQFIHLPAAIHKNHFNWVPPIYMDEQEFFNPKKNKSFQACDTILLLATREKEVVGRIMGIIPKKWTWWCIKLKSPILFLNFT